MAIVLPAFFVAAMLTSLANEGLSSAFAPSSLSVDQAVADFNRKAATNPIGKNQPPLTRDEFMAGLRFGLVKINDRSYAKHVQEILRTETISPNDELSFMTGYSDFDHSGYDIKGWRIDFTMSDGPLTSGRMVPGIQIVIRETLVSSQPSEAFHPGAPAPFSHASYRQTSQGDHP